MLAPEDEASKPSRQQRLPCIGDAHWNAVRADYAVMEPVSWVPVLAGVHVLCCATDFDGR